ncbi:MAG: ethanolamine ammonia-lyase reactivating factor EutA [Chitinophagales bacterium]|nr:ethanolamine ammonia-lyase reactivating factor EutA [Chitinophagales bacterium]MDW8419569.1 exopolyphosphatase [Chitinophagales bacterium]
MDIKRFAAIDIGSNSVRLLIENVLDNGEGPMFKKSALIRVPVRLGGNAFKNKAIPEITIRQLIDAMIGFKHIMRANNVLHYKGCATSAMREAANGASIVRRIKKEAGLDIEIISGNTEAHIIFNSQNAVREKLGKNCVFIDVGGGSTEITVFKNGKIHAAKSFRIGTIRLLQKSVTRSEWKKMREWLRSKVYRMRDMRVIGSGGNINRISKLVQLKTGKPLTLSKLESIIAELKQYSYDERIKKFDLNPDRADVIIPAGEIFITLMKWLHATEIFIPKVGLGDGIVREVYKEYLDGKTSKL